MPCIYVCPCLSRVPPLSLFVLNSKVLCISFCWLFRSGIAWLSSMTGLTCLFLSNRYDIRNIIDGNNWQLGMIYLYLKKIFLLALFLKIKSIFIICIWEFFYSLTFICNFGINIQSVFLIVYICAHACSVSKSCPTLCDPVDCSPPGSSVYGIFQARILE